MTNGNQWVRPALAVVLLMVFIGAVSPAVAGEVLRYSSSAQVRESLGVDGLNAFMAETGIELDLFVGSSRSALHRLMNGFSDIASTAERLPAAYPPDRWVEIPFCQAPLVVFTHSETPVDTLSLLQLRGIFNGGITSWKELGGPDRAIVVVLPDKSTSAFRNFYDLALKGSAIRFDFMSYRSTDVVHLVQKIPWSISFTTQGAHIQDRAIHIVRLDNRGPQDPGYPYHQTFSFVTRGEPGGNALKLVEFAFSEKGRAIIVNNGMRPVVR